jgi:hypothetical protein
VNNFGVFAIEPLAGPPMFVPRKRKMSCRITAEVVRAEKGLHISSQQTKKDQV